MPGTLIRRQLLLVRLRNCLCNCGISEHATLGAPSCGNLRQEFLHMKKHESWQAAELLYDFDLQDFSAVFAQTTSWDDLTLAGVDFGTWPDLA